MANKKSKKLERIFKGIANHHRIDILFLIADHKKINLLDITQKLKCNFKTISEHTRRLVIAGLINKKYQGNQVIHTLSPYGEKIINILKSFSNS